jgi:hypothetical protein
MKTQNLILKMLVLTVFIFEVVPAIGQNKSVADTAKQRTVIYTCAMHPEVQYNQPGTCPKCGMELVKKSEASEMQHEKHKMKMMCPMMNGMENMEKNNSTEQNKITNDSTQFTKPTLKEKKHKMPFMRIGIGMGIMMTGMLLFLMNK